MKKIVAQVSDMARPVAEKHGCTLWDVEFVKEAGQNYLRVFIDKDGGVGIEDCEAVSRELDPLLDEADPIEESYIFEVSSAGAERVLKRPSDFEKFIGSKAAVRLYSGKNGHKEFIGKLLSYRDGDVELEIGGASTVFKKTEVSQVRLRIDL